MTASESVEVIGGQSFPGGLSSVATGSGGAGNLTIETPRLVIRDGAILFADTFGEGDGGTITVTASDSVELSGGTNDFLSSRLYTQTSGNGKAGDLRIETGQLILRDEAEVSVSSEGSGGAGSLEVSASSIRLDNQATLTADTTAGQGNIILRSGDLVLRHGSNITTNATGTATGGNITIDTGVIAALEDSDISANAQDASGGRVRIDAQGIFGTEFRDEDTLESDITASSERGREFSGTVEINTPEVDPNRGLVDLPEGLVDASNQIAQGCASGVREGESKFIVTGRGGLPPSPSEALRSDSVLVDLGAPIQSAENSASPAIFANATRVSAPNQIVEAQGWAIAPDGQVILTAAAPNVTPTTGLIPTSCNGS